MQKQNKSCIKRNLHIQVIGTEGERKEFFNIRDTTNSAVRSDKNNRNVLRGVNELTDELTASTTARATISGRDDNLLELSVTLAACVSHRASFRTNSHRVGRVFDVRATVNGAIFSNNSATDL